MTDRSLQWLARLTSLVVLLLFVAGVTFEVLNKPLAATEWGSGGLGDLVFVATMLAFAGMGAVITARQPRNTVGWIMLGIGAVSAVTGAVEEYARYRGLLTETGLVAGGDVLLAFMAGTWVLVIGPLGTFLILLFPDGRLPSPRWKPIAYLSGFAIAAIYLLILFAPGTFDDVGFPTISNPLGIEALRPFLDLLFGVLLLLPLSILGSAAGLVQRFRRSRGVERLQMKWLAAAGSLVAIVYLGAMLGTLGNDLWGDGAAAWVVWLQTGAVSTMALVPISVGVAILRFRLYDIDRLINRTLIYVVLTGILTLTYLAAVAVLQVVVRPLAGESQLTVAGSTLAVAALFRPLRGQVQTFIDRRFYRRKYDAARTLESFASKLRDELSLDALSHALAGVVRDTMQPASVSVWLRSPPEGATSAVSERIAPQPSAGPVERDLRPESGPFRERAVTR